MIGAAATLEGIEGDATDGQLHFGYLTLLRDMPRPAAVLNKGAVALITGAA